MSALGPRFVAPAAGGFVWTVVLLASVAVVTGHGGGWRSGQASAYSSADSPGRMACTGRRVPERGAFVAHKSLPCGSRVQVCHAGRCVVAVVADRGPYVPGRVLDLTPGAFRALGVGSARVWGVRVVKWRRV